MSEFVGIGDLHLTSPFGKGVTGGLSAYIDNHDDMVANLVISQPLRYAEKKGIDNLILYGDISEKPRLTYEGMLALTRILEQPFQFHIILGNHDLFGEDPALGHSLQIIKKMGMKNVHIYEKPTDVVIGKAPVRFLPWPHAKFHKSALNVAHVDVQGARSDSGRLLESENLSASKATAVIGHIHTRQKVRNSWFSGTLYQTNFGENGDKSFHHITYTKGDWEIEDIPVKPTYRLHTVEALTKDDLKKVPASKFDLVKLILLDGNELSAADYAHLNVVRQRAVSTERDLALARIEDLHDGAEIEFNTDEFFDEWLEMQQVEPSLKKEALKLRDKILRSPK
jgi:hypothetical protein